MPEWIRQKRKNWPIGSKERFLGLMGSTSLLEAVEKSKYLKRLPLTEDYEASKINAVLPDDESLALSIANTLSPYIAASQVEEAWNSLSDEEKILIPEIKFNELRKWDPGEDLIQLLRWRDAWLKEIGNAKRLHKGSLR